MKGGRREVELGGERLQLGGEKWKVGGGRLGVRGGRWNVAMSVSLSACASVCVCVRGRVQQAKPLILLRASGQTGFSVLQKRHSVLQLYDAMTKKT